MVADALGSTRELEALGQALDRMLAGDLTALARHAFRFRRNPRTDLLNIAMDCASWASPDRLAGIRGQADSSLTGTTMDFPKPEVCAVPGLPRLGDAFRQPLVSDTPALLISGGFDGRTPPGNAEEVAAGLPNARTMIVDDAAHDLLGRPAVMEAIVRFLQELPAEGAVAPP
jgi:pimeloyl-ACP methyl ester carboxylesterase